MYILGMESSCDETSCAVVWMDGQDRQIKSNIVASQIDTHRLYGGVVPEIASRAHIEAVSSITDQALKEAGITLSDLSAVAVTTHPGLIGALLVGVNFAKSLAYANRIPLISVNHIHGHVASAYLSHRDLHSPFLALVVSGGHTCFYRVKSDTEYEEIGGTRDDAVGEAFDKIGRVIGMPYPAGKAMDDLAYRGNPNAIDLPSPALPGEKPDFSFSGIKTATLNYINTCLQKNIPLNEADLTASYTKKIVSAIVRQTEKALEMTKEKTLVLSGGVSANSHLRSALQTFCDKRHVRLCMPELSLCGDNGAMIACAGYYEYLKGNFADTSLNASALDD